MSLLSPLIPSLSEVRKIRKFYSIWVWNAETQHLMHKVWSNYNSCTCRSSENTCSSNGGVQEKGKRRPKQDETQFITKKWCIFEFHPLLKVNVLFCSFVLNLAQFWTELRVLVLCFLDFTKNFIVHDGLIWILGACYKFCDNFLIIPSSNEHT